ncbi:MAG: response regulator [Reichenbachiella sp.]|uniref:LytR/AlgR family response regulator transcription factor n=1 Tax=Reichenbachiella sp. TaxID=2184521 RepID=UPI003266851C
MAKVKILIVEDELIIAEDMRDMLESLGYEVVGVTGRLDEARRLLAATAPDIAMVDITLGTKQDGLDLASHIINHQNIPFVFCTSHADKGTVDKAKQLHPHGYLVKPFEQNDLFSAIEVALSNFSYSRDADSSPLEVKNNDLIIKDSLFVKEGHLYVKVKIEKIQWLSPDGNYTTIHEEGGKKHLVRMPLKDLHDQLPQDKFFRSHRSFVVNLASIEAINNQNIYIDSQQIPLGKNYRDELLSQVKKMQ